MNIKGKIFKFDDMSYKVIASNNDIVVVENMANDKNLKGDVEFFINPSIDTENSVIYCSTSYSFGLTKTDYYNKIKENMNGKVVKSGLFGLKKKRIEPIDINNTKAMANALHKYYYKIPTKYLELVVSAYQDNM